VTLRVSDRIVVVGGSLAGLRAIEALRQAEYSGEIVAVGAEHQWPYDRPPLSKQFLKGEWDADRVSLRREGSDALDVSWRLGVSATSLDAAARRIALSDGDAVEYGGLVIATGATPRRLPAAEGLAGVHVLRGLDEATALRHALAAGGPLVVVGAGFIGMEVAASARELGLDVTVVEMLPVPLVRGLGATLGEVVARRHRDHGVDVRCGVAVESFVADHEGRVEAVKLAGGDIVEAANVLVGIGVTPEVGWLAGSGLDLEDGVLCDATGATALPDVVAAGDVARWHVPRRGGPIRYEHWTSAVEQAGVAAARLLAGAGVVAPHDPVPFVWSDQFELRITVAGEVAESDAMHVAHGDLDADRFIALFGREGRLVGAVACRRPRPMNAARDLLERGATFEEAVRAID
jgi:3-phenylpropionate/trans-cinnamate dioxygenase ferredoxin reductase subunit